MAAETGRSVITFALKKAGILGIGRNPSAAEINDGLTDLNDQLAIWATEKWMTWDTLTIGKVSTGADFYTIGPGGDYDVNPRPNRISAAFLRQLTQPTGLNTDSPVEVIPSREEYDRIALKTLTSFTQYVFLDTNWPLGIVRPYPLPTANIYSLFLTLKGVLPVLTLDTVLTNMPPSYIPAMKFNLARVFRQAYGKGMKPDAELNRLAAMTRDAVKSSNLQVPELVLPKVLTASSPGYNILSDQF